VAHIESNAFKDCIALESVTMPDSVKGIENSAFAGCGKDQVTWLVVAGSYAYEYADAHGIPYKIVASSPALNYLVNFDPQGGSHVPAKLAPQGSSIGILPDTTREGYLFDGWYTSEGTKITSACRIDASITFYAHWTKKEEGGSDDPPAIVSYAVTFDSQGGSHVFARSVPSGSDIGDLPVPSRMGYIFDGWYTAKSGGSKITFATKVSGDMVLYAHWKKVKSSSPASVVNQPAHKDFVKITANAKQKVKEKKTITVTLTKYENVTVKSVSISAKHKKLVNVTKTTNAIKLKGLKKGKAKVTVILKNGNKKTFTITVK
jgi:uncharacterized repeat protein (TIGR02543 family)